MMIYRYGFFRDPEQGWIAGVAAGLACRFGLGVAAVRLAFVVLAIALTPLLAILAYVLLAAAMPVRPVMLDAAPYRGRWRGRY